MCKFKVFVILKTDGWIFCISLSSKSVMFSVCHFMSNTLLKVVYTVENSRETVAGFGGACKKIMFASNIVVVYLLWCLTILNKCEQNLIIREFTTKKPAQ